MSDLNSLPIAPEFAEVLSDTVLKTVTDYLNEQGIPQEIIQLINNLNAIDFYRTECYRAPQTLIRDRKDRLDIESIIIKSINAVVKYGGVFHGSYIGSERREVPQLVIVRKGK